MKASKFIVLAGGILGILAFFLPLVSVTRQHTTATVSAFQVVKGIDEINATIDAPTGRSTVAVDVGDEMRAQTKDSLSSIKGIVLAIFVPAVLLALIGGLGVGRRKFGRVAGTFSLLFGVVGLGIGAILKSAAEGDSGIGLTLLLVTGVAGIVGGLMALVKPERAMPVGAVA